MHYRLNGLAFLSATNKFCLNNNIQNFNNTGIRDKQSDTAI